MTKDKALKMAIEALEACKEALEQPAHDRYDWNPSGLNFDGDIIVDNYEIKLYNELDEYPDNSKDR